MITFCTSNSELRLCPKPEDKVEPAVAAETAALERLQEARQALLEQIDEGQLVEAVPETKLEQLEALLEKVEELRKQEEELMATAEKAPTGPYVIGMAGEKVTDADQFPGTLCTGEDWVVFSGTSKTSGKIVSKTNSPTVASVDTLPAASVTVASVPPSM